MKLLHRHVWKVIDKRAQPSMIETYAAVGATITTEGAWPEELAKLTRKPLIVTRRCEVCGSEEVKLV